MGPEARLLRLAASQYSVFSRSQALGVGMSSKQIDGHLRRGRWARVHLGVYILAGVPIGIPQQIMAANLACGPDAVASHDSAAVVWGLTKGLDIPHVSVPIEGAHTRPGIVVHRRRRLEVVTRERIRVTPPMLTLLDLAGEIAEERLERYLDDMRRRGSISLDRLRIYLEQPENRRRPGSGVLREAVAIRDGSREIGSDLETLLFRAIRMAGLPLPVAQHPVRTRGGMRRIDFAYPHALVAIELDGFEEHGTRSAFESDRQRHNELEELGWRVLHFTWTRVRTDPFGVAFTIGTALGLVPKRWGKPRTLGRSVGKLARG